MVLSALHLLNSCDIVMVLSQLLLVKQAVVPVTQLLVPAKKTGVKTLLRLTTALQKHSSKNGACQISTLGLFLETPSH